MKSFKFSLLLFLGLFFISFATHAEEPLPAANVFHVKAKAHDPNTLLVTWDIKPKYFLYRDRIKIMATKSDFFEISPLKLPQAKSQVDSLGHTVSVYRNTLKLPISIVGLSPGEGVFNLQYQGCADNGFCYPPETISLKLSINTELALTKAVLIAPEAKQEIVADGDNKFYGHHWSMTLLIFLGLGILLSFTPCVLPMIPVLSGILVGHGKKLSTLKAFALSLSYVLGMAITYALIGAVIARLGHNLQIILQSPIAISVFSALFFILALSMFGAYELKLPTAWQSKLATVSYSQARGHYLGALIMGALSTLILSPCVTAPLIGALGYIAQTGDIYLGTGALFMLGLGMGLPLLLIGASLGKLLPHAGMWMNRVKELFGVMLLGVGIYLLSRIIPPFVTMLLWACLLLIAGVLLRALRKANSNIERIIRAIGILCLAYGVLILIGATLGNTNPLKPLEASRTLPHETITITTLEALEKAQREAYAAHRAVVLDFYADWCTSCKVIESKVLVQPDVQMLLKDIQMIKVDITKNNGESQKLLSTFGVIAPPTFLFFDKEGYEHVELKLVGEISEEELISHLKLIDAS